MLLSHADRTRVIADEHRRRIATRDGLIPGTVLVDGFVRAAWTIVRRRDAATLLVAPFGTISGDDCTALSDDGLRPLAFAREG